MPYYAKSEDWLHQSALLLQARPSTTKITTRYHLKPARRLPKPPKSTTDDTTTPPQPSQQQPAQTKTQGKDQPQKPPRGHLILKTYDPASGVTLKYKTSKAAEVGRLVQMLGTLGRGMAGVSVPEQSDEVMADAPAGEGEGAATATGGSGVATPVGGSSGAGAGGGQQQQGQGGGGGGGKGKKKKGKR